MLLACLLLLLLLLIRWIHREILYKYIVCSSLSPAVVILHSVITIPVVVIIILNAVIIVFPIIIIVVVFFLCCLLARVITVCFCLRPHNHYYFSIFFVVGVVFVVVVAFDFRSVNSSERLGFYKFEHHTASRRRVLKLTETAHTLNSNSSCQCVSSVSSTRNQQSIKGTRFGFIVHNDCGSKT